MIFSGKNELTPEKRHAKVLISKKEQTFSCFFFKNLKFGLDDIFTRQTTSPLFIVL